MGVPLKVLSECGEPPSRDGGLISEMELRSATFQGLAFILRIVQQVGEIDVR